MTLHQYNDIVTYIFHVNLLLVFQLQQSPFHSLTTVHDDQFHFSKQHILIINNTLLHDIT